VATDWDRRWQLGDAGGAELSATAAELAARVTGRAALSGDAPELPRWL
jgi:hypothetical protein